MLVSQRSCSVGWAGFRARILESIHVVFAGRELRATQSDRCSGISGKLKSNTDFHCRRCLEGENGLFRSVLLIEVVNWVQYEVGMCSQVLLFGQHTWCGRKCGVGHKSQSEMCLGKVQGVISYHDSSGCIIPHKGKGIQGLCPDCIVI